MKRALSAGVLGALAALLLGAGSVSAQQAKLGYINTQAVLAQAQVVRTAQQTLQQELQVFQARADSITAPLEAQAQAYESQRGGMAEAARTQRETELRTAFQAAQQRVAQIEQEAEARRQAVMAPVEQQVRDAIEAVRRAGNFTMIFEAAAVVAPTDPELDITDEVLARLNGAAPAAR